ncbi:Rubrerythrin [Alkaliphilus metalliredigens QYMF]|uniref:Rubrerythrin n=1 Tax=Alkaliphilus metalliredigens (strain QYMF) TaxID=293826 RepID=A6TVW9_ALKMQ|nr:ferritin family protein [Alkaliphilus metalliredigens]ABR50337.1 Rubrerythrin [Alkaliphilus metalliredigens QYMF]
MIKEELDAIKQAILNEVEGFEFYQMAAKQAGTEESKEAFMALAKEELEHAEYLKDLFNKVKDNQGEDFELAFVSEPPSPNIYQWSKMDKQYTSLGMSVFGIGIQMEKDSIEFYKEAKKNTKLEQAEKLYDLLIKWEFVHLNQFTEQYNVYKEEWWAEQGFAPY